VPKLLEVDNRRGGLGARPVSGGYFGDVRIAWKRGENGGMDKIIESFGPEAMLTIEPSSKSELSLLEVEIPNNFY
jgi:hypothetical protein